MGFPPGVSPLFRGLSTFLSASVRCPEGKDAARKSCRRLKRALGEESFNRAVEDALANGNDPANAEASGSKNTAAWAIKQMKKAAAGTTKRKGPTLSLKERMALSQKSK